MKSLKCVGQSVLFLLFAGMNFYGAAAELGSAYQATPRLTQTNSIRPGPTYLQNVLPILMGKCARCHNEEATFLRDWLDYETAHRDRREIKRRVWDSWRGAFFKQSMPAANSPESQAISEEERRLIRDWASAGAPYGVRAASGPQLTKAEKIEAGRQLFSIICAACHQPNGQGIPTRFPPLAGSDFLNTDKHRAIRIVLNGFQGEIVVNGQRFNNSMPKLPLSDQDIANALTYVYNSFGNSGQEVTPTEVTAARVEKPDFLNPTGQNRSTSRPEEKSPWE